MSVRLGYACITLRAEKIIGNKLTTNRKPILASFEKHGVELLRSTIAENLQGLFEILKYNESQGFRFFRISSEVFPHWGNPKLAEILAKRGESYPQLSEFSEIINQIGNFARTKNHRLTMHPGQFARIGASGKVLEQTIIDLTLAASFFEALGLTPEMGSGLIIHGGSFYKDQVATTKRMIANINALPFNVAQYLVFENDEFVFGIKDLLPICEHEFANGLRGIPLCVDFFHHEVMMRKKFTAADGKEITSFAEINLADILPRVVATWTRRGIKPKCHWSNKDMAKPSRGAHAPNISSIPRIILDWCRENQVDIMLEAKNKDLCMMVLLEKYYDLVIRNGRSEWILKNS